MELFTMGLKSEQIKRIASSLNPQKSGTPIRRESQEAGTGGGEYWNTVKAIAKDIKEEFENYSDTDVSDQVWQSVDGNEYIIYYDKNLDVLKNSNNSDAISDAGVEIDTSKGWQNILTQVAFYAMEQDVWGALSNLGWDGDSFEGDEYDY
jgi:hypothetical protein